MTGVTRFDRLFADVHSSLMAVREARSEEAEMRGALARRLGLPEAVAIEVLGARLRERTARLAQDGLTLQLEFTGIDDVDGVEPHVDANAEAVAEADSAYEGTDAADPIAADVAPPTATLRTPSREPQRRELRLLEALAQAALSGATIYVNMGRERRHTERLLAEVIELEGRVDSSFVAPADREHVRAKLEEAKSLLPELNSQAREVCASADILVSLLDEAANTAPVAPGRRRAPVPSKEVAPRSEPPPPLRPAPGASPGSNPPPAGSPAAVPSGGPTPARAPSAGTTSEGAAASGLATARPAAKPANANPGSAGPPNASAASAVPPKAEPRSPTSPPKAAAAPVPNPPPGASSAPAQPRVAPANSSP